MKVAVYSGTIPSTTFIEHLINGLGNNGVEVLIFGKKSKAYKASHPNIKVYDTPNQKIQLLTFILLSTLKLMIKDFGSVSKIIQILKQRKSKSVSEKILYLGKIMPILLNRPHVFHLQWVKAIDDFYWVKSILDVPIVVSLRGAHINYSPLADKELAATFNFYFPKVDFFHGVSDAIISEAAKYGLDPAKSAVIRPAVQRTLLQNPLSKRSKAEALSILSVGRFHWKKGYVYALDAMKILLDKGVKFQYTIVAGGDDEEIPYQIESLGLQHYVKVRSGLPHQEVIEIMKNADLFLLPSVEEGIANVVLEAMAVGTPVISTDCGGMREVVVDGENGFLVPVRNPEAVAKKVEIFKALTETQIEVLKTKARETILRQHLVENQIVAFKDLYQKVINATLK